MKLSVKEVAKLLGETEQALRMKICRRHILHKRWGKQVVILKNELEKFVKYLSGVSTEEAVAKVEVVV